MLEVRSMTLPSRHWGPIRGRHEGTAPAARDRRRRWISGLERLEGRSLLAVLDIGSVFAGSLTYTAGTGVSSQLTVSVSGPGPGNAYSFTDGAETITLTPAAISAGWSGSWTN